MLKTIWFNNLESLTLIMTVINKTARNSYSGWIFFFLRAHSGSLSMNVIQVI